MVKRVLIVVALLAGSMLCSAPRAEAGVLIGRVAPVRRVAAHAVLPPYPMARRVVAGPIYRPVVAPLYRAPVLYGPAIYGPRVYAPGVSIGIGY